MIAYKGQHTIHKRGGQIYWRAEHGEMEGIDNGFAFFTSRNLLGEDQKTRFSVRFGLEGTQEYHIENTQLKVNHNQFLVMNEGVEYTVNACDDEDVTMLAFCFNEDFVSDFIQFYRHSTPQLLEDHSLYRLEKNKVTFPLHTLQVNGHVNRLISRIVYAKTRLNDEEVDDYSIFNLILESVFADCNALSQFFSEQEIVKESTKVELFKRLSIARDYMQAHFAHDVNLNELSRVACLSPYHFHRAFKKTFGITPKKYVTGLRIERAKWLLINKSMSVQMVCHEVGFRDVSSFTRLFAGYTGMTPSIFRNSSRKSILYSA